MRLASLAAAVAALALPQLAAARPITAGVGFGVTQSKADAQDGSNTGSNTTLGLFGRLGLTERLSGQLELQRIHTDDDNVTVRAATLLGVFDLSRGGHLVPIALAGLGVDVASSQWGGSQAAHRFEAGLGLEYRTSGGLVIGADVRIGSRSVDSDSIDQPVPLADGGVIALYMPSHLRDGEYRSARLKLAMRF